MTADRPVIHVSYAWGGESDVLVDGIASRVEKEFELRRDRSAMRPGDWISHFMFEIGQSQCVLVVLSHKYLQSHYCMRELLYLHQSSLGDKASLLERIVPVVLDDARIDNAGDRLDAVKYWTERRKRLETDCAGMDIVAMGASTREELLLIRDFEHHCADMLAWVSDVLMPRGAAAIATNDFKALADLLIRRTGRLVASQ